MLQNDYLLKNCFIWNKVFKNGLSEIYRRQPLKNFTWSILEYFVSFESQVQNFFIS